MKHTIRTIIVVFVAMLLVTSPVLAREHEPIGEKIRLDGEAKNFPANQPFFTEGGWDLFPRDEPGQWFMVLKVDGVLVKPTYVDHWVWFNEEGDVNLSRNHVFNFPDGMTGVHTFERIWILPCRFALEWGLIEECANPNADFEFSFLGETIITFVGP